VPQGAIDTRGGDLKARVICAINLKRELQLARDLLAVLDCHELLRHHRPALHRGLPRQINCDAQQPARGAFYFHQVIAQTCHGLFNDLL